MKLLPALLFAATFAGNGWSQGPRFGEPNPYGASFYMTINGNAQRLFHADRLDRDRSSNFIQIENFALETSPIQGNSPFRFGRGMSALPNDRPVVVTKLWGPASDQLLRAFMTAEPLSEVQFGEGRPWEGGPGSPILRLTNAAVRSMRWFVLDGRFVEQVEFAFTTAVFNPPLRSQLQQRPGLLIPPFIRR
ncbi:MAG: hypothetical protein HYR64_05845 [Fimbriimonas ginsengisoli]|uniref:Uncharacterized protein n=1 Tax=Fimbriimonas ginsengisoli TaxID=1005039 RepID=A0A931PTN7_FIMGI|nr:hypothetical protein [Fimbriimonas ginsengisoli]